MLSLGCGKANRTRLRDSGKFRWLIDVLKQNSPIVELLMQAQSTSSIGSACILLGHTRDEPKVVRIEPPFDEVKSIGLDDYKKVIQLAEIGAGLAIRNLEVVSKEFLHSSAKRFAPVYTSDDVVLRGNRISNSTTFN